MGYVGLDRLELRKNKKNFKNRKGQTWELSKREILCIVMRQGKLTKNQLLVV